MRKRMTRKTQSSQTVLHLARHRNGMSGAPFHVALVEEVEGGQTRTRYVDMGNGPAIHEAFERISRVALRRCHHRLGGSPNSVRATVAMAQLGSTVRSMQNKKSHVRPPS